MSARKKVKDEPTFEESLKRLEKIVELLEEGDVPLEQALMLFEEGKKLGAKCGKQLTELEKKALKIIDRGEGSVELEPFGVDEDEA